MTGFPRRSFVFGLGALFAWAGTRPAAAQDMRRYICLAPDCSPYIYDPVDGDPDSGIAPGTPFPDIPADWYCPDCGGGKADFVPLG